MSSELVPEKRRNTGLRSPKQEEQGAENFKVARKMGKSHGKNMLQEKVNFRRKNFEGGEFQTKVNDQESKPHFYMSRIVGH